MKLQSNQPSRDVQADEFEVILDEDRPASASTVKPATYAVIEVIIPRGIRYECDFKTHPGGLCIKIPVEVVA
jgi:hypothetical protein